MPSDPNSDSKHRITQMTTGVRPLVPQVFDPFGISKLLVVQSHTNQLTPNTTSPIYRLPVELVSDILIAATIQADDGHRSFETAMLLSNITSRLRHIAIHTSALWSKVAVSVGNDLVCLQHRALLLQLERSANRHLDVAIKSSPFPSNVWVSERFDLTQSLCLLQDIVGRAYSIVISSDDYTNILPVLNVPSPSLRSLQLDGPIPAPFLPGTGSWLRHVDVEYVTHDEAAKFLCECPPLQSLVLHVLDAEDPPSTEDGSASLEAIYEAHGPTLESLRLTLRSNLVYAFTKPRGGVMFPNLRSLELTAIGVMALDAITAPGLESFSLECNAGDYEEFDFEEDDATRNIESYVANYYFVKRHMNTLRSVSLSVQGYHDYPWDSEMVNRQPIHFTHLHTLELELDASYAERLCRITSSAMKKLTIDLGDVYGVPWKRMISFIHDNSTYLSTLSITCGVFMPIEASVLQDADMLSLPNLETFHSSGADLVLLRVASAPKLAEVVLFDSRGVTPSPNFGYCLDDPQSASSTQINLPALVDLEAQYPSPILPLIRAPKLETLTMPGWETGEVFVSFLRHHPSIQTLITIPTTRHPPSGHALTDKSVFLPYLRTLVIQNSDRITSLLIAFNLDVLQIRDSIIPRWMPKLLNVTRLELDLTMFNYDDRQRGFRDLHGIKVLNLTLTRRCSHVPLLSAMAMACPRSWLFPDLVEIELCFIADGIMSTTSRELDFDFGLLQALIIARKEQAVVKSVEALTLRKRNQALKWKDEGPHSRCVSPLSPDMCDWFARNVTTFRLESFPPESLV